MNQELPSLWGHRRPRILIVDDQAINIRILALLFQPDHEVFMARSGAQALAFCRDERPDLILLDVMMPDIDGFEVCRQLMADPATWHIPVIFITGRDTAEDESRGLEIGAVDFIAKPINPSIVKARVRTHLTLKAQSDALRELAYRDGLTGVPNRRRFDQQLDIEWRACLRSERPLAVLMVDIDAFKPYNDHYGHLLGDGALRCVAGVLQSTLRRPRDFCARYGGEEFICLLPESDLDMALHTAEYLRAQVEAAAIAHAYSAIGPVMTVSIGAAVRVPDASAQPAELLHAADDALYRAKREGRNRVGKVA